MSHRIRRLLRHHALDLAILGLAGGAVVEFALLRGPAGELHGSFESAVPPLLAMTLPLLAWRRYPFAAPAAAITGAAAFSFLDGRLITHLFFTFAVGVLIAFLFGYLNDRRRALAGLLLTYAMTIVVGRNEDISPGVGDIVFNGLVFGAAWVGGRALNRRLEQARATEERLARVEREREERARAAVGEERARIARELHDVVGHHVSVMTVQASAVRRLLRDDQQREREALEVVERTGREALAEMRRMVGVLRRPEESPALAPQPSLGQLDKLVDQTREAGLPVELRVEGDPVELPAGLDLTAYRLVQEGLTNALRHARARSARVLVRYGAGDLELLVDDDGRGDGDGDGGGGHGLVGMRERVAVYGGDLEAGPGPSGGFRLRARLPLVAR